MIKNIEQLDENELSYVKNALEKYLIMQSDDETTISKYVDKIDKQLKKNNKEIKNLERKIIYLRSHENNDLVKVVGSLISLLSGLGCVVFNDANNIFATVAITLGGVGVSYTVNEIVNVVEDKERQNIYIDMDLVDSAKKDNEILQDVKDDLLEHASYHKRLKAFINK